MHAWQDYFSLSTYRVGEASPLPQFAILTSEVANYPYPLLNSVTKDRQDRVWRTLNLENEYLFCRILPDLGGHLYSCRDKRNGREMFYTNPVIKPADIGLRGAWTALGIESNFPIGHSRDTISPVDFAVREMSDGSGQVTVEDIDRVSGMQWRVQFILHPGSTALEERVTLYNRSAVRWPYYWWANAAVAFDDPDAQLILPARLVTTHTTPAQIIAWPPRIEGEDGSVVANHKDAGAWFAYASHEPFFGIFKPTFRSGITHYADPRVVVGKKLWLWGSKQDAWVESQLTDNFSSYLEMQGGLFQNQTTFEFLTPGQTVQFSEFWIPVQDLGGVTRVTPDVILHLERNSRAAASSILKIELSATHVIRNAKLQVISQGKVRFGLNLDLDPRATFSKFLQNSASSSYTILLTDSAGKTLLRHVEGNYQAEAPDKDTRNTISNACSAEGAIQAAESTLLGCGDFYERQQRWNTAWSIYATGRKKFPSNMAFVSATGNLALNLQRFAEATTLLSAAVVADPSDVASLYGLGLAQAMVGCDVARQTLQKVPSSNAWGTAAALQLALLAARAKDEATAVEILKGRFDQHSSPVRIGALTVALLRRTGHQREAQHLLNSLYATDPADNMLRFERVLLGGEDPDLWVHLSIDGERVLDLVDEYLSLGSVHDALRLLSYGYLPAPENEVDPGAIPAAFHPLIIYYRAFVRAQLGQKANEDWHAAAKGVTRYVFPNRWSSVAVLEAAIRANPSDVQARLFLGRLFVNQFEIDKAIGQWQEAQKINRTFPQLDADLGQVLAEMKKCPRPASPEKTTLVTLQTNSAVCDSQAAKAWQQIADPPL